MPISNNSTTSRNGKINMKKLTTAATLVVGAIMASQTVHAQFTPNNLYMGFQNALGGGNQDYIINLGSASSYTSLAGSGMTVDLSGYFSMSDFNSLASTNTPVIMGGVVGGSNGN